MLKLITLHRYKFESTRVAKMSWVNDDDDDDDELHLKQTRKH